ncbi:MAG: Dps family protein [Prolixibacteraceae bacterium]
MMKANNVNTVEKLNHVLADLQLVYQNQRTMHWLVKGQDFYMLHKMFEEFYTETAEIVDEVAERILMLGGVPLHQFSEYLKHTSIQAIAEVPKGKESLKVAVANFEHLLAAYREISGLATENNDEGTAALFSELIASTEKKLWMLNTTLS